MYDSYNRNINYLRISVTDRCNLRCRYCMPAEGLPLLSHDAILSFEEIVSFVKVAVHHGVNKVRITGGEPLVRNGIVDLTERLSRIGGIDDLSMTTNGLLLTRYAAALKDAGLQRVNISLDTIDPERYREITRTGSLQQVLRGIEAAKAAGLAPIKINCVIKESRFEKDAAEVNEFALQNGYEIRFIREMDLARGIFYPVDGGDGGKCSVCNRLRLTATGDVKPCLFNPSSWNVREIGNEQAFFEAVRNKPACGSRNLTGKFSNIGG